MASTEKLLPVTLPSWPTFDNCVTWSQDNIAVACGETVYILTPKDPALRLKSAGHPQWQVLNLQANVFRQDEWPDQIPDTIKDFSIGEEQSNSIVVAISWSAAGLGVHRRSVLGVLTSNLILSIWELSGEQARYHRTCIVNTFSASQPTLLEDIKTRRAQRIRSFTWVPPIKHATSSKWGVHYLVTVNDNGIIRFLEVTKRADSTLSSGKWNFNLELDFHQDDLVARNIDVKAMSPLQRRIYMQAPITKINLASWSITESVPTTESGSHDGREMIQDVFVSKLTALRAGISYSTNIVASVSSDGQRVSLRHQYETLQDGATKVVHKDAFQPTLHAETAPTDQYPDSTVILSEQYFEDVIRPIRNDFDSNWQLCGHTQTRFWGATMSTDGSKAVACITLHPSDMIEYTIQSATKCILVFMDTGRKGKDVNSPQISAASAQERILQFARHTLQSTSQERQGMGSLFDKKLCRTYANLARISLSPTSELRTSLEHLERLRYGSNAIEQETQASRIENTSHVSAHRLIGAEDCEICGSSIPFTSDIASASCISGHQFSRCQLSFLAVQEPGISKYCSQCSKQFLDLNKLGPVIGPSFAQTMFEEFDTCPYCQAKFRG